MSLPHGEELAASLLFRGRKGRLDELFSGDDVTALLRKAEKLGAEHDQNAPEWSSDLAATYDTLAGAWASRWNGGTASERWVTGVGWLQVFDDHIYIVTHDPVADCFIATRRVGGDLIAGHYINLRAPSEVVAWAGRIVDEQRIDGYWMQGRWDLRRLAGKQLLPKGSVV